MIRLLLYENNPILNNAERYWYNTNILILLKQRCFSSKPCTNIRVHSVRKIMAYFRLYFREQQVIIGLEKEIYEFDKWFTYIF